MRKYQSNLAFVDFLFILLLAFISMFILALILINPVTKKSEVERKAEFLITLEWDKESRDDVDIWVEDPLGKVGILARIKRAQGGNFGDHKPLANTNGIYEMRIFKGNGYRVYYAQQGDTLYLLLIGGSKDSQTNDISKACTLWQQVKDQEKEHPND